MLGEQHHRTFRLKDQVDIVIHDSPFIMGLTYIEEWQDYHDHFLAFAKGLFNSYNNINIFLERDVDTHAYQEYGRNQTLAEAQEKDREIIKFLNDNNIPFVKIKIGGKAVTEIVELLQQR